MSKPMREAMPTVAAWIDELRETFGADTINAAIRNGVGGGDHFYASENGQQVGSVGLAGRAVTLAEMVIRPREDGDGD